MAGIGPLSTNGGDDAVLSDSEHSRAEAAALCRASGEVVTSVEARTAGQHARLASAMRGHIHLAAGGSEAPTSADGHSIGQTAALVRTKVDNGWLRRDPAIGGMVLGHGSQVSCDGCDGPILVHQVEVRPRFADGAVLRFHRRCFKSWLAYSQRRSPARRA